VGVARATVRNLTGAPQPDHAGFFLEKEEARPWVEKATAGLEAYAPLVPHLEARRALLFRKDRSISLAAREGFSLNGLFYARPYPFTIFETRPVIREDYSVVPGGFTELGRYDEVLLVGVSVPRKRSFGSYEVIAAVPLEGGRPGARILRFEPALAASHAAHIRMLLESAR
jgi:hypothetical protein